MTSRCSQSVIKLLCKRRDGSKKQLRPSRTTQLTLLIRRGRWKTVLLISFPVFGLQLTSKRRGTIVSATLPKFKNNVRKPFFFFLFDGLIYFRIVSATERMQEKSVRENQTQPVICSSNFERFPLKRIDLFFFFYKSRRNIRTVG